jgi:hypothetical protein
MGLGFLVCNQRRIAGSESVVGAILRMVRLAMSVSRD